MLCWVVEKITEAGEMVWVERPAPVRGRDEFLVRVNAAGVNFADTLMTRGLYQRSPRPPSRRALRSPEKSLMRTRATTVADGSAQISRPEVLRNSRSCPPGLQRRFRTTCLPTSP
jgi:hypothetical protein